MALEIADPLAAKHYVNQLLQQKQKIMGMGHREYKVVDPRAAILKPMAEALCAGTEFETVFQTLKTVESFRGNLTVNNGQALYSLGQKKENLGKRMMSKIIENVFPAVTLQCGQISGK